MSIQTTPVGLQLDVPAESDIRCLTWSNAALAIDVAREVRPDGGVNGLTIRFAHPQGFRCLDEADLARYWVSEGFVRRFHVLSVSAGGWASEESTLQGYASLRKEWLIVTGNTCVSVFANAEPEMSEASWTSVA